MFLNVQKYLVDHSLADLARDHGVYARWSTANPFKFSLNYDQLEARDNDVISQECRGLVLECERVPVDDGVVGSTRILALPMHRFFNYGTGSAAPIILDQARFYEKLDGTCCILYWDRMLMRWCIATRSVPDADLPIDGYPDKTFSSLFWKAWKASGGDISALDYARGNQTFVFELCTPENQIVVRYPDYQVFLLAVRNVHNGVEDMPDGWAKQIGLEVAPHYKLSSVGDMMRFVNDRNPSQHEGIVICDDRFNRVKVKSASYMAMSRIRDAAGKSPRAILEVILSGKDDDVASMLPDYLLKVMDEQREQLKKLIHYMDDQYKALYDADRKTFALHIQSAGMWMMGAHMARYAGKCNSFHSWIMSQQKDGQWSSTFLDGLLDMMKRV